MEVYKMEDEICIDTDASLVWVRVGEETETLIKRLQELNKGE